MHSVRPIASPRPSLRLRVAAGFALLGLVVSLTLGTWLFVASRDLEQQLIDESLRAELEDYLARLARNPASLPPRTTTIRGYIERPGTDAGSGRDDPPAGLIGLRPGLRILTQDGLSYRAAVHQGPDFTLYMLHSRAQLADRERRFVVMLALGIALAMLISAAGGWWLAGHATAPVRALAERVRGREPTEPLPSAPLDMPDDELGELARTIDGYLHRLSAFVEREHTFVGSASHELRTPLAIILGAAEVLERDPHLDERGRERVRRITRAARGMSDLTTALLVLAREGQGQTSPPTPCPVAEVLAESIEMHRPLIYHKPVALECRVEAQPVVTAARPLVSIAIGNLIRNACTYTASGRITVTLTETELIVADTGPGIPPEEIDCLFGQDLGCPRTVRGEGIGLPLVKRIADIQGWQVSVVSKPGEGARFSLRFG